MSLPKFSTLPLDLSPLPGAAPSYDLPSFIHGLPGIAPYHRGTEPVVNAARPWIIRESAAPLAGETLITLSVDDVLPALLPAGAGPVLISGVALRAAGASLDLELAWTLCAALDALKASSGTDPDRSAARLSVVWAIGADYFPEVARLRAARLLWAEAVAALGAKDPRSLALKVHGVAPASSVSRATLAAMAAGSGQVGALHLAACTDATGRMPATLQQIAQRELGLNRVLDPWGGSRYLEGLTEALITRARAHMAEVAAAGGLAEATGSGLLRRRLREATEQDRADQGR
ncbi:methylmalonyl-CoA mutase family protein [Brevundimonas sp. GCM10030266]|uniref:methylmalonyl-CoA mutase family protein n=1 Tax=Brevundimonas sp. GCM10030266 TaxID=3273386 RepID=UPI0036061873